MKYTRLTKEQFGALHQEFANFLASQSIDKNEWDQIKLEKPEVAEQELDVFSDLIWEGVLNQTKYLEHFSSKFIFLFACDDDLIHTLVIKITESEIDLMTVKGLEWLINNIATEQVEISRGSKSYTANRNEEIFSIIQQGAVLSNGDFYNQILNILE